MTMPLEKSSYVYHIGRYSNVSINKNEVVIPNTAPIPFDLSIIDSIEFVSNVDTGVIISRDVPRPQQLFATLAFELCHMRHSLIASELEFMRHTVNISRGEIAQRLNITVFDVTDWELPTNRITLTNECNFRDLIYELLSQRYPWLALTTKNFTPKHYRELTTFDFHEVTKDRSVQIKANAKLIGESPTAATHQWSVEFGYIPN